MENINYKSDRAIVTVAGVIEEMMMLKLTDSLQRLHQDLFYNKIELEISSPGGSVVALDHCIEIMERLRQQGVRFTTRALMSTSSAAAFLVSLGDDRQTTRSTRFLYHKARLDHVNAVTARKASEIVERTHQLDKRYLNLLVQRAKDHGREYAQDLPVAEFDNADWPVIRQLLVNAGNIQSGNVRKGLAKTTTLRELREYVKECLVEDNKLNQLYQTLFDLDQQFSAALAMELRLVDGFVDNDGGRPDENKDGLCIPQWTSLYPPNGQVGREVLCRHTLILGETGSGKTASAILPVVSSAINNRSVGCALIIDPKREIKKHLEGMQKDIEITDINLIEKDNDKRSVINLMSRKQEEIEALLKEQKYLAAARKILVRSASLSSYSPAKMLAGRSPMSQKDPYWEMEGVEFAWHLLAFVLLMLGDYRKIREKVRQEVNKQEENSDDMHASRELFRELEKFAEEAGVVAPPKDLGELREDIKKNMNLNHIDGSSLPIRRGMYWNENSELSRFFNSKDGAYHTMLELDEVYHDDEYYREYHMNPVMKRRKAESEEDKRMVALQDKDDEDLDEEDKQFKKKMEAREEVEKRREEVEKRISAIADKDDEDLDEEDKQFKKAWEARLKDWKAGEKKIQQEKKKQRLFEESLEGSLEERLEPILKECAETAEWLITKVKNTNAYKKHKHFAERFDAFGLADMTNPDVHDLNLYLDVEAGFPDVLRDKQTGGRIDNLAGVPDTVSPDKFEDERLYYRPADLISITENRCSRLRQAKEFVIQFTDSTKDEAKEIRETPNVLALALIALETLFKSNSSSDDPSSDKDRHTGLMFEMMAREMLEHHSMPDGEAPDVFRKIKYWMSLPPKQMAGVVGYARPCFTEYTHQTAAHALHFGVEPYYQSIVENDHGKVMPLDFDGVVSEKKKRSVFLFQPDIKNDEALVGRALKAVWFEAVLYCKEREENGASMPMVAYIADEFHRFITIDREHGEQSFLDTCRSFGAFCVLACQSVSSMKHALAEFGSDSYKSDAGISILLNNTASKLLFRTTDRELLDYISHLTPSIPDIGSVTSIRPLSTLQPGECYASMADGRFERCQLKPYTGKKS